MLGREPAMIMAVISAVIMLAISFGLPITEDQKINLLTTAGAVLALITGVTVRSQVTPTTKLEANNIDVKSLKSILVAALVGGLMFTPACAKGGGKAPERTIAVYGLQVVNGLDEVSKTAKELQTQNVITVEQYKVFLEKMRLAYQSASKLADTLKIYDEATSEDAASQVRAALNALSVLVPQVATGIGGPGAEKIANLVGEVNKLVLNIALLIRPAPSPAPPPEAPELDQFPALEKEAA